MQALGQVWGRIDPKSPDLKEVVKPITAPRLYGAQLLVDFWRQADDGCVVGRDIPSRALSTVLRNLVVFEPMENNGDFRARIAGTALLRRFGRDITGARMSDLYAPASFEHRRIDLLEAINGSKPVMKDVEMRNGNRKPLTFELIVLPVLAPRRAGSWALSGTFFHED